MSHSEIVIRDEFRRGVRALADTHGYAEVIAEADDHAYVFVDIGEISLDGYNYDQQDDDARVILRVHKDFPRGQNYGMVTIPVLTVDEQDPDNTTRNHQHAQCLRQVGIEADYLYWSRDWRELTVTTADDMAKAMAFVRGTLRNPFDT